MKRSTLILLLGVAVCSCTHKQETTTVTEVPDPDAKALRAIIGEASNQGPRGMLAVACAIRNRGTLKGVYGLNAPHVDREPAWVWLRARRAWAESATNDITAGATHWENLSDFGAPAWSRHLHHTITIGDHSFFR